MAQYRLGLVTLRLERISFSDDDGEASSSECPKCSGHLECTQPDAGDPDRLIGACENCGALYLIDRSMDNATVEMMTLPSRTAWLGPSLANRWSEGPDVRSFQAGA